MAQLNDRRMDEGESPAQFAHELGRLAKLAYPGFEDPTLTAVTRDAFIRGLPEELTLEIKKERDHSTKDMAWLTDQVKRL